MCINRWILPLEGNAGLAGLELAVQGRGGGGVLGSFAGSDTLLDFFDLRDDLGLVRGGNGVHLRDALGSHDSQLVATGRELNQVKMLLRPCRMIENW